MSSSAGAGERIASAPGRVNLLGEHVDHQGGTVLPVAVQLRTTVTYTPGEAGSRWEVHSDGHEPDGDWTRYVRGVIDVLEDAGYAPQPGRLEISSTVPEGSGLGSSAALQVAVGGALCDATPMDLAALCRRAENEKVGVPCGLMDQTVSACAIAGHALVLDCSDGTFFHLELPEMELWLFDSLVHRSLKDVPYAERLEEAARPGSPAARHVAGEMARVGRGIELLDAGDLASFGLLMGASHASLRDLYRCSHPAVDEIVASLEMTPGVHGARLVGAGWGGCVLAVTEPGIELEGGTRLVSDDGLYRLA